MRQPQGDETFRTSSFKGEEVNSENFEMSPENS